MGGYAPSVCTPLQFSFHAGGSLSAAGCAPSVALKYRQLQRPSGKILQISTIAKFRAELLIHIFQPRAPKHDFPAIFVKQKQLKTSRGHV